MQPQIDKKLLAQAQKGSFLALEKIIRFYEKPIYFYICRFISDRDTAADLAQETFIKLFRNAKSIDPEANFKAWLYTIATNTVYDYLRKIKGKSFFSLDESFETIEPLASYSLAEEEKIDLEASLESLRPEYMSVVVLYYFEGLTYEEIAEILHLPINTVKTYLYRAKAQLKNELDKK